MYLLDTVESIPDGLGFAHYDTTHLLWLTGFLVFTIVSCLFYRRADTRTRRIWRIAIASLIVLDELFKWSVLFLGGHARASYLPFHLCSINIFLIAVQVIRPSKLLNNFLYLICIPAALMALLFPTWTELPATSLLHIHSFTVHILLAAYPITLTAGGDIDPDIRMLPKCFTLLAAMAAVVYGINVWLGTNFMFLMSADKGNPLYWFAENWGSHLLGFPVLLPLVFAVMYGIAYGVKAIKRKVS